MTDDTSKEAGAPAGSPHSTLPKIDLSTFILSLSTSALYQLGQLGDPTTGERAEPNHALAQQTIDTLEMLRERTLGNLDPDELKLFDSLLYELRMKFVETRR